MPGLSSFIAAFVLRRAAGSSINQIKKDLRKNVYTRSLTAAAAVFKCQHAEREECCVFDATKESIFRTSNLPTDRAVSEVTCRCCKGRTSFLADSSESNPSIAGAALEEPLSETAREKSREKISSPFIGELNTFKSSYLPHPECNDGGCAGPLPLYKALSADKYSTRSSPCGGGGDAFNVVRVRAFGSKSSDVSEEYEDVAIVDTGANRPLFGPRRDFVNRRTANILTTMADGSQVQIGEQGDFTFKSEDSDGNALDPLILRDVSILKGSPINLVSVSMLCEEGTTFHFERGNSYFVFKGNQFKLIERDGLYLLRLDDILTAEDVSHLRDCEKKCGNDCATEARSKLGKNYACAATWELWHERFAHASKKRIKFLFDNGSAEGLAVDGKYKHDAKCKCSTCLTINNAKLHIGDVRKFDDPVTRKDQLIYSDISGPFPP